MQVLQALHHPNVVSCKEAFVTGGKLCILMDYCSEGEFLLDNHAQADTAIGWRNSIAMQVIWPMH